MQRIHAVFIA